MQRLIGVLVVLAVLVAVGVAAFRWATAPATWPEELNPPIAETLFENPAQLTAADKVLFTNRISEIAQRDDVVLGLLDGRPWPNPEVSPAYMSRAGRTALIGGGFTLQLDGSDYSGAWPSTRCSGGRSRGVVQNASAKGLQAVTVQIDLTFERATSVIIPPVAMGPDGLSTPAPQIDFGPDLPDRPWYTGTCPRLTFSLD